MNETINHYIIFGSSTVQIIDSYDINKLQDQKYYVSYIKENDRCPSNIQKRSSCGMIAELRAHNVLYFLHIRREQTVSCDFDNEKWYRMIAYYMLSPFDFIVELFD